MTGVQTCALPIFGVKAAVALSTRGAAIARAAAGLLAGCLACSMAIPTVAADPFTIVALPDTSPVVDDPAVVDFLLRRARDTAKVRVLPSAAITKGLRGQEIAEIGLLKEAGAVVFTDGFKSIRNAQVLRRALTYARDFDALIAH